MVLPFQDYRRTALPRLKELPRGLDAAMLAMAGRVKSGPWARWRLVSEAELVHGLARTLEGCTAPELQARLDALRTTFRRHREPGPEPRREGLAVVAEIARRELGLTAHLEQIMGAVALGDGFLAEMATGEGKTLTVALAAAVAGWSGQPCHVVTANDYLAERDAEWLRPFFRACGLTVGCVIGSMPEAQRRESHAADITYTTSKELLADFLRDRLRLGKLQDAARRHLRFLHLPDHLARMGLVLRGIHTAFVDEADNILIDEAVTPLIISRQEPNEPLLEASRYAYRLAMELNKGEDYRVSDTFQEVELTMQGWARLLAEDDDLPATFRSPNWRADLVQQALKAREFFHRDRQYVVEEGKVVIVDESTGRLMPQRSWRGGLQQAVEAKEGLEISNPAETLARMSFQRFFRLFRRLSGLTGTAQEAAGEFWFVYGLPVVRIPTHRPVIRQHLPDRFFATEAQKWSAVTAEVLRVHATGQPILVGTRSVESSERLGAALRAAGVDCCILNATRNQEEAEVIAQAGEAGRVTVATNMAGRGTDIRLSPRARESGGLHVIATERHSSQRIDRQLFGRSGRQGDPGSAQAFVSAEDDLLIRFCPGPLRRAMLAMLANGTPGAEMAARKAVAAAQARAQKLAFHQRRAVVQMDGWFDEAISFVGPDLAG